MSTTPPVDKDTPLSAIDDTSRAALPYLSKFKELIDRSNDVYFVLESTDNRFTYINDAVAGMLGFSPEEARALMPNALVTAASMDALCDAIPRAIAASSRHESAVQVPPLHIQLIAKDRKRVAAVIHLSVALTSEHTAESISGIVKSELSRQNAQSEDNGGERLLRDIFDALPSGCIVCTPLPDGGDFLIQNCNTAAQRIEGISVEACIGKRISELLPDLKRNDIFTLMQSVAKSGIAARLAVTFYATEKGEGWREYYICRLSSGSIVVLFSDETGRKKHTAISTELIESFGVLAGGIAHDFNNVAGLIFGQIDMVLSSLDPQSEEAKRLQQSMQAFDRMRDLTAQLSSLSKKNTPVKKRTDIRELLHSMAVMALTGTGIEYTITAADDPVVIEADADLLSHAFTQILNNAVAATGKQGRVTIDIRIAADEAIPKTLLPGNYVEVEICDNGCGIPEERQGLLYKPAYAGNGIKKGIGLAVVRSIVSRHGGTITIESSAGSGTRVSLLLPVGNVDCTEGVSVGGKVENMPQGRVLIMDDEEILLDIATQMCRRLGLEVATTGNSMTTVERYREEFRVGRPFDLVLLDMTIPGGSGGLETVATLRKIDPEIKAVAMSGYADHEVMADPAKFGFTAILTKPFRLNEFGTVLRAVLPPGKFQVKV